MLLELIVKQAKLTKKQLNTIISECVSKDELNTKIIAESETLEQFFNKLRTQFLSIDSLKLIAKSAATMYLKKLGVPL